MKQLVLSAILVAISLFIGAQTVKASDIPNSEAPVAFIELIEVPAQDLDGFIADWNARSETARKASGFISTTLYRALLSDAKYQLINITQWQSYDLWAADNHENSKTAGGFYRPAAWSINIYEGVFRADDVQSSIRKEPLLEGAQKDPRIKFPELPFVFINLMEMKTEDVYSFIADWKTRSKLMGQMPAAMGSTLYHSVLPDNNFQIVNVSQWQSYNGFIDAINDPTYAEQLSSDLGHTPSIKLIRGFYRPVASYMKTYEDNNRN